MGSIPVAGAKKERSDRFVLFLSKPQATSLRLGISLTHEVRRISSAPAGLYLITRPRASYLRLDDIQHFVLMICNSFGIDDIHACGVIFGLDFSFVRIGTT
ncbi:MAG: hypothetical protein IKC43_05825, partial [Clostridia bacterium]|nr:hypothetical protein [Clostridia bacterium]